MPFALLDDQFHSNPKVIGAGLDGAGVYARALSYCSDKLTDGYVPQAWVGEIARKPIRNKVTTADLWIEVQGGETFQYQADGGRYTVVIPGPGYFIPDFLEYNPTRESALAKREELSRKRSEAGKKGAQIRWQRERQNNSKGDGKPIATAWQTDGPRTPVPLTPTPEGSNGIENLPKNPQLRPQPKVENGHDAHASETPYFALLHAACGASPDALQKLTRAAKGKPEAAIVRAFEGATGPNVNDPLAVALAELGKKT